MRSVVVVVGALLLAACGSATDPGVDGPGTNGAGHAGSSAATCPDPEGWDGNAFPNGEQPPAPLPDDVTPTALLRCTIELRDIPGEGRWSVLVASWAESHLDRFVSELRKPDDPPTDGSCPAMLVLTPWFALVTADGHVIRAAVPSDVCGQPRAEALEALAALPFTTLSETRIKQVETAEAQASGCPQQWKDMVAIMAGDGSAQPAADQKVLPAGPVTRLRVCGYASDGAPADQTPGGTFTSGRSLKGVAVETALAGLEAAPAADPCATRATTFAVLMTDDQGFLTIETDGCRRMLTEAGELRAAPAALLAALK